MPSELLQQPNSHFPDASVAPTATSHSVTRAIPQMYISEVPSLSDTPQSLSTRSSSVTLHGHPKSTCHVTSKPSLSIPPRLWLLTLWLLASASLIALICLFLPPSLHL